MRKIILLLAMLVLASMTVFAEWTASGTAEYKLKFNEVATNDSDEYIILNLSTMMNETTKLSLEYDTDDENPDAVGTILVNKKVNDKVEVQVSTDLISDSDGTKLSKSMNDDTYLKMMISDKLTVNVYPFEAGLGLGDELETCNTQDTLGFGFDYKLSDTVSTLLVVNTNDNVEAEETYIGIKSETTVTKGNLKVIYGLSFSTVEEDFKNDDAENYTDMAASVRIAYTVGKLALNGEALYAGSNMKDADAGSGLYAKATYDMGAKGEFSSTELYVEATVVNEDLYYDDMIGNDGQEMKEINVGVTGTYNDVYMTPELSFITEGMKDSEMELSMTVGIEF